MRQYCIGAFLLDRDDPSKVIGRLREPLLKPNESEREGYVPNVVYTCGALLHNGDLIIPYGLADHATGFATVPLAEVLAAMEPEASMTDPARSESPSSLRSPGVRLPDNTAHGRPSPATSPKAWSPAAGM